MSSKTSDDSNENRQKFIQEMQSFINNECSEIGEILAGMSWTPDHILKSRSVIQCPHDPGHYVPESSFKHHISACRLRKLGLSDHDVELQQQDFFYKDTDLVGLVHLDEGLLNRILWNHCMDNRQVHMGHHTMPVGMDDWCVKLLPQERLAVYNYCVQTLKKEGKMANVERDAILTTDWERIIKKGLLDQAGQKPKSEVELLAMLRDQRRRRQSYRAKNVHVTKKSYTEIIREVIANQMEVLIPTGETEEREIVIKKEREYSPDSHHHSSLHKQDYLHSHYRSQSRSPKRRDRSNSSSRSRSQFARGKKNWNPHRRNSSRSPMRRDRSNSSSRSRSQFAREKKSWSPDRRHSRSLSPREHSSDSYRQERNDEDTVQDIQHESGEIPQKHRKHTKRKGSKHRKHKKHKNKSAHSDSDGY